MGMIWFSLPAQLLLLLYATTYGLHFLAFSLQAACS
jgi:hypothetical protein